MWKDRKKAQKRINKSVRAMNKNIMNDNLWRGRFYVHQIAADWERFQDCSGGMLTVQLEIRDKKTGTYRSFRMDNYDTGWKLWENVNDFIVNSGVWDDIDAVKADTTNWSKVKFIPKERKW